MDFDDCDSNAVCINKYGSFGCKCKAGYNGYPEQPGRWANGRNCFGKLSNCFDDHVLVLVRFNFSQCITEIANHFISVLKHDFFLNSCVSKAISEIRWLCFQMTMSVLCWDAPTLQCVPTPLVPSSVPVRLAIYKPPPPPVKVRTPEFLISNSLAPEKNFEFIRGIEIWRLRYFKESVVWGSNFYIAIVFETSVFQTLTLNYYSDTNVFFAENSHSSRIYSKVEYA